MNEKDKKMEDLVKNLSKIQRELICTKNLFNAFGKYKYRNLESIFDALKSHLNDELVVKVDEDLILVGDRYYIKAIATITNGKDSISATAFARESLSKKGMDDSMVTISTSSYASKSAMQKLFMLDDTADIHEVDGQDNTTTTAIETIRKLIKTKKVVEADFLKYFKVTRVGELSYDNQQEAVAMLQKK